MRIPDGALLALASWSQMVAESHPVQFEAVSEVFNVADRLMAEDDWQLDGQFAPPQMHVRAADAGHLRAHERAARFHASRQGIIE